MQSKKFCLVFLAFAFTVCVFAQESDRDFLRSGNKRYREENLKEAETNYSKALNKNKSFEAYYNIANVHLFEGQDSIAFSEYQKALTQSPVSPDKKAKAYHNMGNMMYAKGSVQKKGNDPSATESFQMAVDLYKSALRNNPSDDETRYNLAMAQHMLKKSQSEGGGGGSGQDNQEQKKDSLDNNSGGQQKETSQEKQQEKDKQDNSMSDEVVEQLLNSAQQDEKNIQRKIQSQQQQQQRQRFSVEKDW